MKSKMQISAISVVSCLLFFLSGILLTAWAEVPVEESTPAEPVEEGAPIENYTEEEILFLPAEEDYAEPEELPPEEATVPYSEDAASAPEEENGGDSEADEDLDPFFQFVQTDTLYLEITADMGVFAPGTSLCVTEISDEQMTNAVETVLVLEASDHMWLYHSVFCISGPEPDGSVWVSLTDFGHTALESAFPDAELNGCVLRVWEQEAPEGETEYGVELLDTAFEGDVCSFALPQMGCYELLTIIQLPAPERTRENSEEACYEVPEEIAARDAGLYTEEEPGTEILAEESSEETAADEENESEGASPNTVTALEDADEHANATLSEAIQISFCTYAPEGYVMLSIDHAPEDGTIWMFDGRCLLGLADGSYRMLIPDQYVSDGMLTAEGIELLTAAFDVVPTIETLEDVNRDGVVNIADANIVGQFICEGVEYYDTEQISLFQRIQADVDGDLLYTIADLNAIINAINAIGK